MCGAWRCRRQPGSKRLWVQSASIGPPLTQWVLSDEAHAQEHALEVHLPFMQQVLGTFKLVPFVVGSATPEEVAEVLDALWGGTETLIVISSDLSHYLPYPRACAIDEFTAETILRLTPQLSHEQACGATPINGLLLAARARLNRSYSICAIREIPRATRSVWSATPRLLSMNKRERCNEAHSFDENCIAGNYIHGN